MQPDLRGRPLAGTFVHAPVCGAIEVLADAILLLDEGGDIAMVASPGDAAHAELAARPDLLRLTKGQLVLPGFIDLHVHAPQYPQLGRALDEPLEVWLQRYTFPLEARYADLDFARERYAALVADFLANGTTTALYFATVHVEASLLLAELCLAAGQRALVGKVAMDDPAACPDWYRDASPEVAVAETRRFVEGVRALAGNDRVLPVVTPRFIPSCSDEALAGLGALAAELGCHVQTHCSESDWAHAHALDRYGVTDTAALDSFGLLGRRTVLAHSVFLTDGDMATIAARGAGVAHCALSNIYFANAVFPLRRALERGVHVGLGTDISGGPSASLFEACRTTVQVSRQLEDGVDPALDRAERGTPGAHIDMATAFHLATAGGGMALDLPVGTFRAGQHFDAIVVDPDAPLGSVRRFGETDPAALLETVLYAASRPNLAAVYVGGRRVAGAA